MADDGSIFIMPCIFAALFALSLVIDTSAFVRVRNENTISNVITKLISEEVSQCALVVAWDGPQLPEEMQSVMRNFTKRTSLPTMVTRMTSFPFTWRDYP